MGFADEQSSGQLHQRFGEFVGREDHCIRVADDDGFLAGYAWAQDLGPHLRSGDSTVRMHDLWVDEHARLGGVGRLLFNAIREWTTSRGARWLQWHAGTTSAGFYTALGITPMPSEDDLHPFYEIELEQHG
jgi:GNAT superfamily N-acetyltransferase